MMRVERVQFFRKRRGPEKSGEPRLFSDRDLRNMIVPLLLEQFLVMLVGIADTVVVSYAGEAAVSGVSLVNSFNTIFIYLFTALASGGAVMVSQYIGNRAFSKASETASQLLMISALFSLGIMALTLAFHKVLLRLLFGRVEPLVMEACVTYLRISAYSYPALAVYNAGTALYRSMGKTKLPMNISILANLINVAGNLIGVFYFHAGVAGVAYPSLISRAFSAVVMTAFCFRKENPVRFRMDWIWKWNGELLGGMMRIAVPNGIENGIFQFIKVALSSIVALFGTYQIAANGIAQSIWSLAALVGTSMGPVFITVIGQCMGAGDTGQAEWYFKRLMKWTVQLSIVWNGLVLAAAPLMVRGYSVTGKTGRLIFLLVLIHNIWNSVVFPFSGPLSNGLRAAGDVRFTMIVSIASTIFGRLIFSVMFGIVFQMGVIGIALAMCLDWTIRAVLFWRRLQKGKWKQFRLV